MKNVLFTAVCLIQLHVLAQNCDKVLFTGRVIDSIRPQTFYNLMLVNKRTGQGVFGQPNGSFSIYVSSGDSVFVSVKEYITQIEIVVPDSNCQYKRRILLEPKPKDLREIKVKPLRSLEEIREEREALAMRETRLVTGLEVMQSPITALYQAFSKKERNKQWIAEQEYKDDQRRIVKELLQLYVSYDIISLNEDQFDDFIFFLNVSDEFLKTASDMELITFIKDKFEHFRDLPEK
ncbi:MAG: hypothetical protein RIT43_311 [Bacteroidota bacterium]